MISTCPSCLSRVEHSDSVTKVVCTDCGTNFEAFYQAPESSDENDGALLDPVEIPAPVAEPSTTDFSESDAAFADIRSFGETLNSAPPTTTAESLDADPGLIGFETNDAPVAEVTPGTPPPEMTSDCIMTSGPLNGYSIEGFFPPVSVWAELADATDPLKQGYASLWETAQKLGANAVIGITWSLSSDQARVLIAGTPVRANKS